MRVWTVAGLTNLSPRRRNLVVGIVLSGVLAAVVLLVALLVVAADPGDSVSGVPSQDRLGPVLVVPGYGGSADSVAPLAQRIRAIGRRVVVVQLPDGGTGDLVAEAAVLNGDVETLLRQGAPSVDVVGYSAGGVVARLWFEDDDGVHKARRVVTLGAPNHGTTTAAVGDAVLPGACPQACQELVPGSALLAALNRSPAPPIPWLSLWTVQDQTVVPPVSAGLAGAVDVPLQSVCPDEQVQHGQLPTDPLATALVLQALGTSPPTAPPPSACARLRAAGA